MVVLSVDLTEEKLVVSKDALLAVQMVVYSAECLVASKVVIWVDWKDASKVARWAECWAVESVAG